MISITLVVWLLIGWLVKCLNDSRPGTMLLKERLDLRVTVTFASKNILRLVICLAGQLQVSGDDGRHHRSVERVRSCITKAGYASRYSKKEGLSVHLEISNVALK